MRIAYLLLHDFRFASVGFREFSGRMFHFSKEYARRMAEAGHHVRLYVMSEDTGGARSATPDGYEIKGFGSPLKFPPLLRFGNNHSLGALRDLEEDRPDLVHLHNYYLWNFFYVAPLVRRLRIPLVAQFHGGDPIRRLKGVAYYASLMTCDQILVPTRVERAFLVSRLGLPSSRVTLFPSTGVDASLFRRVGDRASEPTFVYVGRFPRPANYRWEKAPHYLPDLVKGMIGAGAKVRLKVAGDGPGLPAFRSRVRELGIQDAVEFLGSVDQQQLPNLYSQAWLTFAPMHMDDIEPFWGGTVQESLACGTPVVAFNDSSPGFREYGLLVRPRPGEAALAIRKALDDPGLLWKMGEAGAEFVRLNCDWGALANRLEQLYMFLNSPAAQATPQRRVAGS